MVRFRLPRLVLVLLALGALFHGAPPAPAQQRGDLPLKHYAPLLLEGTRLDVSVKLSEQLRWLETAPLSQSLDLAIVADFSASMRQCYTNFNECAAPNRRIDYEVPVLRVLVRELLETQNSQGADHRAAFVTYGHMFDNHTIARTHVTFTMTTAQSQSIYSTIIGTVGNPRTIPASELTGASAPAAGLQAAQALFANSRTVDRNGQPVRRVVLFLTDGVANVFLDPPLTGITNQGTAPFFCRTAAGTAPLDDPQVQYTCPAANDPQNTAGVRPPLRATVEVAEAIRATYRAQIYGIVIGQPNGHTAEELRMHMIAPTFYGLAANPSQLVALMNAIVGRFRAACQEHAASAIPAAGASVEVRNSLGDLVFSGAADAQGLVAARLAPGAYELRARHPNVVAPSDPSVIARTYARLTTDATPGPALSVPLSVTQPLSGWTSLPTRAQLTLEEPATAQCP